MTAMVIQSHGLWVASMRIYLAYLGGHAGVEVLSEHLGEEFGGVDAVGGVVGAGVDAAWFFEVVAEVAGGGFADCCGCESASLRMRRSLLSRSNSWTVMLP